MIGYAIHFMVYTFGVIGLLLLAYIIAKKCMGINLTGAKKGNLVIEDVLNISPRKTLYVLRAYNERFLIASDPTTTSFLAKLNSDETIQDKINSNENFSSFIENKSDINEVNQNLNSDKKSVIQSMLEKIK